MSIKNTLLLLSFFTLLLEANSSILQELHKEDTQVINNKKIYFGEQLFEGNFKSSSDIQQNPNYILKSGDIISVKIWGAYEFIGELPIDLKGNIFIPRVGSIKLKGIKNSDLQKILSQAIKTVFNDNVQIYALLKAYQPISIFVSGSVNHIGLYSGFSKDSILQFIDKANGVIKGVGSYRDIVVMRNNRVVKKFDLYHFLVHGHKSNFRFKHGDVIVVNPIKKFVEISGVVSRPYIFEFSKSETSVKEILKYALPHSSANQFIHTYNINNQEISKTYPINQAHQVKLHTADKIKFFSNQYATSISIAIEGEHRGARYRSIPKGTSLYSILKEVSFSPLSNIKNIQLFRKEIAKVEKQLLEQKLQDLEARALTTDSSTPQEASIREKEVSSIMQFIARAKKIEPKGQLVLSKKEDLRNIILKEGDRIVIPQKSNIIVTQGEVNIPHASTFKKGEDVAYYIEACGGFSPRANQDKILILKANGAVTEYKNSFFSTYEIELGDSILVLSKSDTKNLILAKDITQIIYQVAVGAAVILKAF